MDSVVTCLVFAGTVHFLHLSLVHGPDGHIRCLGAEKVNQLAGGKAFIVADQPRFEKELSNWAFSATCATSSGRCEVHQSKVSQKNPR